MNVFVYLKIVVFSKCFVTYITLEQSVTSVNAFVFIEITGPCK